MNKDNVFKILDKKEIDFRITSDHCIGYIFYFLDGSVYPRRFYDNNFDKECDVEIIEQSGQHIFENIINNKLQKDWFHRIYAESIDELFENVGKYLISKY